MNAKRLLPLLASLAVLASACTQKNTGDEPANIATVPQGLDRFLLFPNPVAMNTGGFETNTTDYATAYYAAIDPNNAKDTIDKWKTANGFGGATGTELLAVFRDTKDLGYGRRMTGRMNTDGSVAFYVENYSVTPNASADYSSVLNVEAAIRRDTRWHVGTNAIEWSSTPCTMGVDPADCNPNAKFAKYYNFSAADGTRQLAVDLDGNGPKTMPGPCITCHGGRGDPLTPPDASTNKPRFPLVEDSVSRKRGDVQARLHGMNVDSFGYSPDIPGFSKADQQATLKTFNQWILCTYPLAAASAFPEDACRVAAGANEWQGTADQLIKSWYGGNGMPNGTFLDAYLPAGWAGNASLYSGVVAPFCRTCHILRGTRNQDDIDFMTVAKFQGYADRIKAHVFDRGTMPLALIVYNDFWNSSAPTQLANFINPSLAALSPPQIATDSSGAALKPGRPVANPGPNRMVRTTTDATLTGEDSLFASSFNWSMVSGSATIANPNSMITKFNAANPGNYVVRLTVGNGSGTDSKDVTIVVSDTFPDPASLKFAHIKNLLQSVKYNGGPTQCVSCHVSTATSPIPPVFYDNFDRNGSGAVDATDDAWLLKAVQGRVNLTEIQASPLLRKPSGNHHAGGTLFNVTDLSLGGGLSDYSIVYNWIVGGMQPGGVAASPIVNGGVTPDVVAFSGPFGGPFTSPNIAIDGSGSIAPSGVGLTYAWSIVSQPLGGNAVIAAPASATTALTVQNVGDYVAQLQVNGGGGLTDTAQRKFTVNEAPFTTDFTPADGASGAVTFASGRGDLVLTSATSALATGNPVSCSWTVISGPGVTSPGVGGAGGPTLDGSSILTSTKACIQFVTIFIFGTPFTFPVDASATLNVPSSALNNNYVVQFTASTVTSQSVTHTIKVAENPPQPSISVTSSTSVAFSGNPPFAFISLSGSSTGIPPFTFTWSIDTAPGGSTVASSITSGASTSTLTARATGSYTVRLTVMDNTGAVGATTSTFIVAPSRGTTFATMTGLFTSLGCTGCHSGGGANPANNSGTPPDWTTTIGSDGSTLWQRVIQRVAVGAPASSLLLLNPENITNTINTNGHGGGCRPGFGCDGTTGSANATTFSSWILDGAPPGN